MLNKLVQFVILSIIMVVSLVACSEQKNEPVEVKLRLVKTHIISMNATDDYLEFPGEVSAAQSSDLGFRISGKLSALNVREGQRVKKDDVLAVLDDTDYVIQLQSIQADYDQANADLIRSEQLLAKSLIAKADFEKVKAKQLSALANLNAANQTIIYTKLVAPFDGIIAKRYVDNFEDVNIMQPVFMLQDLSSLNIKVAMPETIMIQRQEAKSPRVRAIFDSLPNREFPLTISSVSTEADPGSKTYEVTLTMPRIEDVNILPGMSVTVRGTPPGAQENNFIIIPAQSVISDAAGKAVYVVDQINNNQGVIARRIVETGELTESGIVISKGLSQGERIVTAGMSQISEGLRVRISEDWSE